MKNLVIGIVTFTILLFAQLQPVSASLSQYSYDQIMADLNHPDTKVDPKYYQNGKINLQVTENEFSKYFKAFSKRVNRAVESWNKLPSNQRTGPLADELMMVMQKKSKLQKDMYLQYRQNKNNFASASAPASQSEGESNTVSQSNGFDGTVKNAQLKRVFDQLNGQDLIRDSKYFDGKNFNMDEPTQDVMNYYRRYAKQMKSVAGEFNRLPNSVRATDEGKHVRELVVEASNWGNAMNGDWRSFQMKAQKRDKTDAKSVSDNKKQAQAEREVAKKLCYDDFRRTYMVGNAPNIMAMIINDSLPKQMPPNMLAMVRETGEKIEAACAMPKYANIGSCKMFRMRPNDDPSVWCENIAGWRDMVGAGATNSFATTMDTWNTRPLMQDNTKGEQEFTWFSRKVPNREGWRNINRWADLAFSEQEQQDLIAKYQQVYEKSGIQDTVTNETLAPVFKAHEDLLKDAKSSIGKWDLPPDNGKDYSVELAEKQHQTFTAPGQYIKAWLGRSSWKIHKNALGVPLRRTKPGYMYYSVDEQQACQLISYTLTEHYQGGGQYLKADAVEWGYIRFHQCP